MKKARVRIEAKKLPPNASRQDRDRNLTQMLRILKRKCNEYGIPKSLKEHQFFIRPCDIRRKKREDRLAMARQEIVPEKENNMEMWDNG